MKKFLALLLVIVMAVFCFTACGETPADDGGNNNNGGNGGNTDGGDGGFGDGLYSDTGLPAIPVDPDLLS